MEIGDSTSLISWLIVSSKLSLAGPWSLKIWAGSQALIKLGIIAFWTTEDHKGREREGGRGRGGDYRQSWGLNRFRKCKFAFSTNSRIMQSDCSYYKETLWLHVFIWSSEGHLMKSISECQNLIIWLLYLPVSLRQLHSKYCAKPEFPIMWRISHRWCMCVLPLGLGS